MKIFLTTLIIILGLITFLPHSTHAAPLPAFSVTYKDQVFVLDDSVLDANGSFQVNQNHQLVSGRMGFSELMANYTGLFKDTTKIPTNTTYSYDPAKIYAWVDTISHSINIDAQEPHLLIENNKAVEFTAPLPGLAVNTYESTYKILSALENHETTTTLSIEELTPQTKLSELNNLGINELISKGESEFKGSSKNRRKNIEVGVSKIKGVIIPAGAEFSFNTSLGPIEAEDGFVPEIVIKRTGLAPEIGGGICQVSSTVFRGVMNGGFPVTQRKNHSFAVNHYAPQGTDATIYPGVIDLKFINDTPGSILIWPTFPTPDKLIFDFYGTNDGRSVIVDQAEQYDRKSDGSMKANWKRTVTLANGKVRTDVFKSTYLPPALFKKVEILPGTGNTTPTDQVTPSPNNATSTSTSLTTPQT